MSGTLSIRSHLYIVLNWVFYGQWVTYSNLNDVFQSVNYPSTSFTDLAEIVSRIEPVKAAVADGESGDVGAPRGCYSSYPHFEQRQTCIPRCTARVPVLALLFALCPLEKGRWLKARLLGAALNQTRSDSQAQLPYGHPYYGSTNGLMRNR